MERHPGAPQTRAQELETINRFLDVAEKLVDYAQVIGGWPTSSSLGSVSSRPPNGMHNGKRLAAGRARETPQRMHSDVQRADRQLQAQDATTVRSTRQVH